MLWNHRAKGAGLPPLELAFLTAAFFLYLRALFSYYLEVCMRVCVRKYSLRQRKGALPQTATGADHFLLRFC